MRKNFPATQTNSRWFAFRSLLVLSGAFALFMSFSLFADQTERNAALPSYCVVSFSSQGWMKKGVTAFQKAGIQQFLGMTPVCKSPCVALLNSEPSQEIFIQKLAPILAAHQGHLDTCNPPTGFPPIQIDRKPVIYLYPTHKQEILVQLDYQGTFIANVPKYDHSIRGWKVTAYPDGTLIDPRDSRKYTSLFWEGTPDRPINPDLSSGFVVPGNETITFLRKILPELGLSSSESQEFIEYWVPQMEKSPWNFIHFADKEYTDKARLTITPRPDSLLRVFMLWKRLEAPIPVTSQTFPRFDRPGFTVIEWGGAQLYE